jgi:hypothetical protein
MISKPRVYVSSTIHDFRDLRSSIKFYLESYGFEVLLSEYNDFIKPLDKNSYEACLDSLEGCQYYILLVGGRVGGLYDKTNSITRMEYRRAYDHALSGRMKIISFVRREVWTIKEDRKAISELLKEDYFATKELLPEEIDRISNHSSSFISNANVIFEFIDEIARKEEMRKAQRGLAEFPIANWIHQFDGFVDIIDVLKREFKLERPIAEAAIVINLRNEILTNLQYLVHDSENGQIYPYVYNSSDIKRNTVGGFTDKSGYDPISWAGFLIYYVFGLSGRINALSLEFITEAIKSGVFLRYDIDSDKFVILGLHDGLLRLRESIEKSQRMIEGMSQRLNSFITRESGLLKQRVDSKRPVIIDNLDLLEISMVSNHEHNAVRLSIAILKGLEGDFSRFNSLKLETIIPIRVEKKDKNVGFPSIEQVIEYVKFNKGV